jgi:hypothetical protein
VIKALVKNKYTGSIYPEHPRAFVAGHKTAWARAGA